MVRERWGGGSIRGRLVLVALVPILAILPLGVRSAFDDLTLWNETREAEAAASRLSDGAFLEQRVRIEWLSTLDLIAVTSDDMADSTVIDGGLVEIADQARRSFDQAVGDTTQTLETESITAGVFDGRDELLEQVAAGGPNRVRSMSSIPGRFPNGNRKMGTHSPLRPSPTAPPVKRRVLCGPSTMSTSPFQICVTNSR